MKADTSTKKKIAILGGGPSALSTAYFFTTLPDWQSQYDITIYTLGWRLGGKCASSRDDTAGRIEEHGIHIFGSFYHNIFNVTKACNEAVGWKMAPEGVDSMEKMFFETNMGVTLDYKASTNKNKASYYRGFSFLPHNSGKPWEGAAWTANPKEFIQTMVSSIIGLFKTFVNPKMKPVNERDLTVWQKILKFFGHTASPEEASASAHTQVGILERLLETHLPHLVKVPEEGKMNKIAAKFFEIFRKLIQKIMEATSELGSHLKNFFATIDFYVTLLRGFLVDELYEKDIDIIDSEEWNDWLSRHGMAPFAFTTSIVKAPLNINFHYKNGDTTTPASMSAATYLSFALRFLLGKGGYAYRFLAGTGEVVIGPLYQTLKDRGIKFQFFTKVKDLVIDEDDNVTEVLYDLQATQKEGGPLSYSPLKPERVADWTVWPHDPNYDQLVEGEQLKAEKIDLESWWTPWKIPEANQNLKLVKGEDFDELVLGISIGAFPYIAKKLIDASPVWKKMVDGLPAIQTMAYQIWMDESPTDLGFPLIPKGNWGITASWLFPASDVADFSDLIDQETWPEPKPKGLLYFCGPKDNYYTPPSLFILIRKKNTTKLLELQQLV